MNRRDILLRGGATAALFAGGHGWARDVSAPPSLSLFAQAPRIERIAISPDGTRVAYITHDGDQAILNWSGVDGGAVKTRAVDIKKIRTLLWSSNSSVLIAYSLTSSGTTVYRDEHVFAMQLDVDTLKGARLFDSVPGMAEIITGGLDRIKIDGQYRVTASSYEVGTGDEKLYCFGPPSHMSPYYLDVGSLFTEGWVVTPSGIPVAYSDFDDRGGNAEKTWTLYFNVSGKRAPDDKKVYTVKGTTFFPDLVGLGRDGKSVVVALKNPDNDGYAYHEISASGVLGERIGGHTGAFDRSALFHPTTGCLAGFMIHDDWFTYDYFDPEMKTIVEKVAQLMGDSYRFKVADFSEDPSKLVVYGESTSDAGAYYFIDATAGTKTLLGRNYPDLPAAWTTQKQAISYKAADGLGIHAYLTLPPGKTPKALPLIVLPHGGPASRDYIDFDWETQAFASRGYAVLQPNFRGSTGYGIDFLEAGFGQWGRKMQSDLRDGIQSLAEKGIVDAGRVAIYGASYGGYAALAGATLDPPGTYRCAVSVAGVSDVQSMLNYEAGDTYEGNSSNALVLDKLMFGDARDYDAISPYKQAAKAYCPILLIHGTDDAVVPIDQSRRMERALKSAGKDVQLITFDNQSHWEDKISARIAMIETAMAFVTRYNPA